MEETVANGKDEVSALARGVTVLRAIAAAERPLSNRELAELTGIPKATVSRLATTLVASGLLRQSDDNERYALGPTTLLLGNAYLKGFDFRMQARLHLAELGEFAGANVNLGVRDGLEILLIDTLRPRSALILSRMDIGSRMDIATSASGRAYIATLPPDQRQALYAEIRVASGAAWPRVHERLKASQEEFERLGFCSSFGEWHPEIHALGFSLQGPRDERYAVSVGGPAYKLPASWLLDTVAPKLLEIRQAIHREVGLRD